MNLDLRTCKSLNDLYERIEEGAHRDDTCRDAAAIDAHLRESVAEMASHITADARYIDWDLLEDDAWQLATVVSFARAWARTNS